MKKYLSIVSLMVILGNTPCMAGPKGVQYILLSNASSRDVTQFASVFSDGKAYTRGPQTIQVDFAPYVFPSALDKYANAQTLVNLLTRTKTLRLKIYLDFNTPDNTQAIKISANARDFNDTFLRANIGNPHVEFIVSPSLEDYMSDMTFNLVVKKMKAQINPAYWSKITLCRNNDKTNPYHGVSALGFKTAISEIHGAISAGLNSEEYSNDGQFVWNSAESENIHSLDQYNPKGPQYEIQTFTQQANADSNTTLLWRPFMNLFWKYPQNGFYTYSRDNRAFDNSYAALDGAEVRTLKLFFGIK